MSITPAHSQPEEIHLLRHYQAHHTRAGDPYYKYFQATKRKLKEGGLYVCALAALEAADCEGGMTLHHAGVEYASQNSIDLGKLNVLLGLTMSAEQFRIYVESPGNLEVLCEGHHLQGHRFSVHQVPHADWEAVRTHAAGMVPVEVVR